MKIQKTILTCLLTLIAMAVDGQTKIWDNVVTGYANTPLVKVTKVAMYDDHTELSLHIDYVKGQWIRIAPNTMLKTDGQDYMVKESTILKLGEQFKNT